MVADYPGNVYFSSTQLAAVVRLGPSGQLMRVGSPNPVTVTMNGPIALAADFAPAGFTCAVTGDKVPSAADVQQIIEEALGNAPPRDNLTQDGIVSAADVQKGIDAVTGFGCLYRS